jgi:oligopeptide transport system permease protein
MPLKALMAKLGAGLLTVWVVITLTFGLIRLLPGGPFNDPKVTPAIQQVLEARFHLNDPLWVQYGHYMTDLIRGDLGPSMINEGRSVNTMLFEAAGYSVGLGLWALLIGGGLGVLVGTFAGLTRHPSVDAGLSLVGLLALSTPAFVLGGGLALWFSFTLNWLPAATLATPWHYVLPVATLSATPFAFTFLLVRTAIMDTKRLPFITLKQAAGLPQPRIAVRHVLRNSLLPLVSLAGPLAAGVVTGSFAVEALFAIPGLGKYFVNAVSSRDYTLLLGITVVYSLILIALNLLSDVVMLWLDPRLKDEANA